MCAASCPSRITPSRRERDAGPLRGEVPVGALHGRKRKIRADVFDVPANVVKADAVIDYWALFQQALRAESLCMRRDFFATGTIRTLLNRDEEAARPGISATKAMIGSAAQQMARAQAAGVIASWISNMVNTFAEAVAGYRPSRWGAKAQARFAALPEAVQARERARLDVLRHELSAINRQRAWLLPEHAAILRKLEDDSLVPVSAESRALARRIFLAILSRKRWPSFRRLAMRLDQRMGYEGNFLEPAESGAFSYWLSLRLKTGKVQLPIRGWGRDRADTFGKRGSGLKREGALGRSINIFLDDDGRLKIALTRDVTESCAESRAAYRPKLPVLGLDFGLNTLFATSEGDLIGRGFGRKLGRIAKRADGEAARMQRLGRKQRSSRLWNDLVQRLRGLIETEVNRAINHLVALHRPGIIAVEKLDFRGSKLSRRLNRILSNCGRGAIQRKLNDLEDRLGIEVREVASAYTSQTCSCCGYVDRRQRKGENFSCRFCGMKKHADVNGACNIALSAMAGPDGTETAGKGGSSAPERSPSPARRRKKTAKALSSPRGRSFRLRDLVRRFDESMGSLRAVSKPRKKASGTRESAADPRLSNPYWKRHSTLFKKDAKDQGRNAIPSEFAVGI